MTRRTRTLLTYLLGLALYLCALVSAWSVVAVAYLLATSQYRLAGTFSLVAVSSALTAVTCYRPWVALTDDGP